MASTDERQPELVVRKVRSADPWRIGRNWAGAPGVPSACLVDFADRESNLSVFEVVSDEGIYETVVAVWLGGNSERKTIPGDLAAIVFNPPAAPGPRLTKEPTEDMHASFSDLHWEYKTLTVGQAASVIDAIADGVAASSASANSAGLLELDRTGVAQAVIALSESGRASVGTELLQAARKKVPPQV